MEYSLNHQCVIAIIQRKIRGKEEVSTSDHSWISSGSCDVGKGDFLQENVSNSVKCIEMWVCVGMNYVTWGATYTWLDYTTNKLVAATQCNQLGSEFVHSDRLILISLAYLFTMCFITLWFAV